MGSRVSGYWRQNHRANGVVFDGSADYITRSSSFSGAADSKLLTGSFWYKSNRNGSFETILEGYVSTTARFQLFKRDNNRISFIGFNSAGTIIWNAADTISSHEIADGWVHTCFSIDLTNSSLRHIYNNDVSDYATSSTYTNDTIDFTLDSWRFGGNIGPGYTSGEFANVLFWPGVYLDLSVTANRRLFISAAAKPVNPAVAIQALGTPLIALYGDTAAWHTNKGSGGGFTLTGSLGTSSPGPSG